MSRQPELMQKGELAHFAGETRQASMELQIEWLESPWLLLATASGIMTLADQQAFDSGLRRYLDAADGHLYIMCDVRQVSSGGDPKVGASMMTSDLPRHKNSGLIVFVAVTALARFYATMRIQRREATGESGVTPIHMFDNFEEAERFTREVAAVDPKRATVCDPVQN